MKWRNADRGGPGVLVTGRNDARGNVFIVIVPDRTFNMQVNGGIT